MQIPDHGCLRKVEPGRVHFLDFKSAPDLMRLGYEWKAVEIELPTLSGKRSRSNRQHTGNNQCTTKTSCGYHHCLPIGGDIRPLDV